MAGYLKFVMKSRMMGDYQVRFCERLGVKFPLPTRPCKNIIQIKNGYIKGDSTPGRSLSPFTCTVPSHVRRPM